MSREIVLKKLCIPLLPDATTDLFNTGGMIPSGAATQGNSPVASGSNTWPYPQYLTYQTGPATTDTNQWGYVFNIPPDYVEGTDGWMEMEATVQAIATSAHTEEAAAAVWTGKLGWTDLTTDGAGQAMSLGEQTVTHSLALGGNVAPGDLVTYAFNIVHFNNTGGSPAITVITDLTFYYYGYI